MQQRKNAKDHAKFKKWSGFTTVFEVKLWIVSCKNPVNKTHYIHTDTALTLMVLLGSAVQLPHNYPVSSTCLLM